VPKTYDDLETWTPPGYTSNPDSGGRFVGWGISCQEALTLGPHDTPYSFRVQAEAHLAATISFGACPLPHTIVRVYSSHAEHHRRESS
jgi:hypothetical protein